MRNHAVVSPLFWTGETGQQLRKDPDLQRLAMYLITGPSSNMIGLYYLPVPTIAHELGTITEDEVRKALRRGIQLGFCSWDEASEVIFVHEMARFQCGERLAPNDKRKSAVEKMLMVFHKCPLYTAFMEKYRAAYSLEKMPAGKPLRRGIPVSLSGSGTGTGSGTGSGELLPTAGSPAVVSAPPAPSGDDSPQPETKAKKTKPRDLMFDAIVSVTGVEIATNGSRIGKLKRELLAAEPPYTPEDVLEFGRRYAELCDWATELGRGRPSLPELGKHIGLLRNPPPKIVPTVRKGRSESREEKVLRNFDSMANQIREQATCKNDSETADTTTTSNPEALGE